MIPQVAIGLQSALGHKRMAGEYIALSKRYNNFDFTAGLGWGRFGTAAHFDNPLRAISSHFEKNRNFNSQHPNEPQDWFTGESVGIFGGIEYFLPFNSLSLKFDYGADRYTAEKAAFNFDAPAPWSAGLSYSHAHWLNAGIALQGTNRVMARLSIQANPKDWPLTHKKYKDPKPFYKERGQTENLKAIPQSAENENITLYGIHTQENRIYATLELPDNTNVPQEVGRALRHIAAHSGPNIEEITITPRKGHVQGTSITIMRSDVEKAMDNNHGSPQEIWKNTEFITSHSPINLPTPFLSTKGIKREKKLTFTLENTLGLSEKDHGALYRSAIIAEVKSSPFLGFLSGTSVRLNIKDNLEKLDKFRPHLLHPVHSDIADFTKKRLGLETAYIGYAKSLTPELHLLGLTGYLEEFYAGFGGEILYRPFDKRFAFGADIWHVLRRDAGSPLNLAMRSDNGNITTGHINAWYDLPHHEDITIHARAGRFLGTDWGVSTGLEKQFKNGAKLSGSVSISNASDPDIFGGTTHAYHSINLTIPIGSAPYIPQDSSIRTTIAPIGRDIAQSIKRPIKLLEMTAPFTIDHTARNWNKILD